MRPTINISATCVFRWELSLDQCFEVFVSFECFQRNILFQMRFLTIERGVSIVKRRLLVLKLHYFLCWVGLPDVPQLQSLVLWVGTQVVLVWSWVQVGWVQWHDAFLMADEASNRIGRVINEPLVPEFNDSIISPCCQHVVLHGTDWVDIEAVYNTTTPFIHAMVAVGIALSDVSFLVHSPYQPLL